MTLKLPGKLVTLHAKEIAINILKDEAEADSVLEWLKEKINETWSRREEIEPSFQVAPKPRVFDILRLLPKTNCGKCGEATCTVLALRIGEDASRVEDCPQLDEVHKRRMYEYLERF